MRTFVGLCAGLVLGVALGGIPAGMRVAEAMARFDELKERDCRRSSDFSGVVGGMLEDAGRRKEPAEPLAVDDSDAVDPPVRPEVDGGTVSDPDVSDRPRRRIGDGPDLSDDEVAAAKTVLEARRTQARAALIEDAGLDDAQIAEIDDATADMNDALLALTDDLLADVDANGEPSRRDSMVYAADALDALITAADRMDAALDADQRADAAPESLDPLSYVDPAIVDRVRELRERNGGDEE